MRRTLLVLFSLLLLLSCNQVEEMMPLLYPEGEIPQPNTEAQLIQQSPLDFTPTYRFNTTPWTDKAIDEALKQAGMYPGFLPPGALETFRKDKALIQTDEILSLQSSFYEAYQELVKRQWPVLFTGDFVADRFYSMFHNIFDVIEERYISQSLRQLLQEMVHVSLEQYHFSIGDLKEAAWRNTAYLCVALRLLDPDAPTPFIVSGIVRKELDLVQEAPGEAASPLFSLDATGNPCLDRNQPGCIDYSIFKTMVPDSLSPKRKNLRRTMLWLNHFPFALKDKYPLLQVILLTDCVKRTTIKTSPTGTTPAWRTWMSIFRFYAFLDRTSKGSVFFPEVDELLLGSLPKSFDENYFLDSTKLTELEKEHPEWTSFRKESFRFFPLWQDNLGPYFKPLLYPNVGPDISNPLYRDLLLKDLSPTCTPNPGYRPSLNRFLSCRTMSQEDNLYLFCNAQNLSFHDRRVLNLFRTMPSGKDILFESGWDLTPSMATLPFCGYDRQFDQVRRDLSARTLQRWSESLADSTVFTIRRINPAQGAYAEFENGNTWKQKATLTALGLLPQIQRTTPKTTVINKDKLELSASVLQNVYLEPSPHLYHRLRNLTDFIRKNLLVLGYSDLDLDDILIQYVDIAEHLTSISITMSEGKSISTTEELYLQSLLNRFFFVERRLSNYLKEPNGQFPEHTYPRYSKLWTSPDTTNKLLGISGDFHLLLVGVKNKDQLRIFTAPQPIYYEVVAAKSHYFSQAEIRELIDRGVAKSVQ